MKTITIKIIQWSDIKQWWLNHFGVRTIKENARDACNFIEGVYECKIEEIIYKHYGDELFNRDPETYNNCVCELKRELEDTCNKAKEIIHL